MDVFSSTSVRSVLGGATTSTAATNVAALASAHAQFQYKKDLEVVGDSYSGRFRDVGEKQAAALKLQEGISSALSSLNGAKASVGSLSTLVENMLETLKTANDPANVDAAARQFQSQMITLRSMTSLGDGNMLSGPDQRISYDYNTVGAQVVVSGQNMGSSYTIAASDGNVWVPNDSATSLVAYSKYPDTPAGVTSSFYGGTKLNSLSGDAIDFTVGVNGGAPQTLTGTYTNKGVGVVDSWVYDDFTTQAGRDLALKDLTTAQAALKAEGFRYEAAANLAEYYLGKIELEVGVLSNEQQGLTEEQALKAADLKDKFEQNQAALALAMQGTALAGASLLSALPTTDSVLSPAASTQALFDIFA